MRQEEFLNMFQEVLTGKVSDGIIQENITYYRGYIDREIRNGRTEEEVLQSLGDPRLLAKTIEESHKFANGDGGYESEQSGWSFQGNRNSQSVSGSGKNAETGLKKTLNIQGILGLIVVAVIVLAVISLIFSVISYFAPVIIIGVVGVFVYRAITGDGRRG